MAGRASGLQKNGWSGWSGAQPDGQCLPLLIFPCTIKSRSSLLALAHPGGPGKRAVKWLCVCSSCCCTILPSQSSSSVQLIFSSAFCHLQHFVLHAITSSQEDQSHLYSLKWRTKNNKIRTAVHNSKIIQVTQLSQRERATP